MLCKYLCIWCLGRVYFAKDRLALFLNCLAFFFFFSFQNKTKWTNIHAYSFKTNYIIFFSEVLWAVKKYTVSHQELALCRNVSHATKAICSLAWLDVHSSTGQMHSFSFDRHMSLSMIEHTSCLCLHHPIDKLLLHEQMCIYCMTETPSS